MQILEVNGLRKVYTTRFGGASVEALKNINFSVENGEYVAIMGESGSGKTTLLNILAGLDKPTSGQVLLDGKDLASIRESDRAAFRRDNLGFVFQEFNLLDTFSVEDNIYLPLVLAGVPQSQLGARLEPIAAKLGISELLKKYPYEISGARSSARPLPARSSRTPVCCWPTSRPARSIPAPRTSCCASSPISVPAARPSSWSRIPSVRPAARAGSCSSRTARSATSSTAAA